MDMSQALATAARKERSANRYIGKGKENPAESYGGDEMIRRREAARLGSSRLLDRLNAYQGKAA